MLRQKILAGWCAVLFIMTLMQTANGQTQTATLSGRITDEQGLVVPGARVEVTNVDTNLTTATRTNRDGLYVVPDLLPGHYRLAVKKPGFKEIVKMGLTLHVQDVIAQNFVLSVGSPLQSVQVMGTTPLLNTQTSENGQIVDNDLVQNMPLNGRDFTKLTLLVPGAQPNVEGNLSGGIIVDGQRSTSNQYIIDGADTTVGGGIFAYRTPGSGIPTGAAGTSSSLATLDSIQEFKVQSSNYSAQYGTYSGATVSIVTKSGTNQFHGSAFDYFRDQTLDANDYFLNSAGIAEPPFTFNDVGAAIGGPILRNRTFFFGTFEHLQENYSRTVSGTTLSNEARAATLPVMRPLLDFFPLPTGKDNGDGSADYVGSSNSHGSENDFSVRVDHEISGSDHIYGRYSFGSSGSGVGGGLGAFPLTIQTTLARIQAASIVETHTFSPSLINTLNLGYVRNAGDIYSELMPGPGTSGDPFGPDGQPVQPQVAIIPITLRGGSSPPQITHINDFTYRDDLTWIRGKHTLNFGADLRRIQDNLNNFANAAGLFLFLRTADFEQNKPFFFNDFIGNLNEGLRFWNFAPYVQDDWRVSPKLTLNLGLRYELNTVPTEAHNRLRNITGLQNFSTALLGPFGANLYKGDYNNFAPRVGFAYSPRKQTVVRGAFGVFFDASTQLAGELFFNPGITAENVIFGPGLAPGEPAAYPINPALLQTTVSPNPPYTTSTVIDPNLRNAYTESYTFNVQQGLGASTVIQLGYVGNVGRDLYRERVLNLLLNGSTTAPNPNFPTGGINFLDNSADSSYNSLQASLTERMGRRLQGTIAYTWAHSIDNVSTNGGYGSVNSNVYPTDPLNLALDRGNSDFDVTQNLSAGFAYELPFERLTAISRAVSSGWKIDGLVSVHSAFPYTALLGSSTVNDGDPNLASGERPDPIPGQPLYVSSGGFSHIANVAAFQCPGGGAIAARCPVNGVFGSVGRNTLRGFPFRQFDFNVEKDFPIHESLGLEFRIEFFNLFNTPNFANPVNALTSAQFGEPATMADYNSTGIGQFFNSGGPRSIQLALRLHF
jgi:hypothetical protein